MKNSWTYHKRHNLYIYIINNSEYVLHKIIIEQEDRERCHRNTFVQDRLKMMIYERHD